MEIFRGISDLTREFTRPVLTIGNFDGVHRGHQAILDLVIERAHALEGESVLYTFEPHPRRVLQPDVDLRLLDTFEQKVETLEALGLDAVIAEPFDLAFAKITPEVFVEQLIHEQIRPVEVFVGYDFHFGRDREGSMRLLTDRGPHLGFSVTVVPEVSVEGRDVNSTRIRELLAAGEVEEAAALLGRPFCARGEVAVGDRRGRKIGFPTANLAPKTEILPAPGVYFGRIRCVRGGGEWASKTLPVVTNVGYRPTFRDGRDLVAEAHVIDFSGDLYGAEIDLTFEGRLRGERRFKSVDTLREQIARDVDEARIRLSS
ncbi:MAG: bifunctional riboflavin kinase/FAD synthetase [bacterium]|nr:bifunctional riboflavin kinase/FAD synthetase [bacterium]